MWQQNYTPLLDSVGVSSLAAAAPIFVVLLLLGVFRKPAWMAAVAGLVSAIILAAVVYGMPGHLIASASAYGAAFGLFPICWILFWAIVLYRITVDTGNFTIIKDSIGSLTGDRRLQALLIAFAFGAFIEGAAGFGAPVAVAAGMLAGLGFDPFFAAGICLLANTAPVAFGSIGIPVITLAGITGLPLQDLSANVGRICAPVSAFVPAYLVMVMNGWRGLKGVLPAAIACGFSFALAQFFVSNYLGPQLTDILGALAAMASLIILLRFWKPADALESERAVVHQHTTGTILRAWIPYLFLVVLVLLIGVDSIKVFLNQWTNAIPWPNLHNEIMRVPPAVKAPGPYAATYTLNFFTASGTACMFACFLSALALRMPFGGLIKAITGSAKQLALPLVTVASVLALAFLMNYCGATATLGLAFAATGVLFPFFSSLLGWLGVFLTGSDTSANALFGNLQVVTAGRLDLNPVLMAASNSSGGVMGKMISLQSIAVAAAAAGMPSSDESRLFRFTLKHSIFLASVLGLIVVFYAYVAPHWVR
ncbi:MAG TPA: L-lactate permease [Bryobacteraceae bacterium]|nr:L-lactate permease [Bryobacteraceae bacterium]